MVLQESPIKGSERRKRNADADVGPDSKESGGCGGGVMVGRLCNCSDRYRYRICTLDLEDFDWTIHSWPSDHSNSRANHLALEVGHSRRAHNILTYSPFFAAKTFVTFHIPPHGDG